MVLQRRGLGALDVVEPTRVPRRQLPEAHAAPAPLFGVSLEQGLFHVVLAHQRQHPLGRLALDQSAVGRTTAPPTPPAIPVRVDPGATKRADHRLAVPRPLRVPEWTGRTLANEGTSAGVR